jgi:hypothetical protein
MTEFDPSLVNELGRALIELKPTGQDSATVALARRYAKVIEDAVEIADAAAMIEPENVDQMRAIQALQRRVEAQTVLAELGPKLLASLVELGMTPRARSATVAKGGGPGDGDKRSPLDELRKRREDRARQHGTEAVDPSAP